MWEQIKPGAAAYLSGCALCAARTRGMTGAESWKEEMAEPCCSMLRCIWIGSRCVREKPWFMLTACRHTKSRAHEPCLTKA